jgi:hypothetical protein
MRAQLQVCSKALIIAILCLFAGSTLWAQIAGGGVIQGTVTDPSGAVVPGATVTATNRDTGVKTTTLSTGAGFYVLSPLAPGVYTVRVAASGFQTLMQQAVTVNALSVVGLNLALQVGTNTQLVTVSAAPPALNTANGTMGTTIDNNEYTALPLAMSNGPKSADNFIFLLPGVANPGVYGGGFNINGGVARTGEIYINGLPSTNSGLTADDIPLDFGIPVEAIEQFQIDTSGTPAMYQGQGTENFVVKSGTNQVHGSLYEDVRNNTFDARSFFSATVPVEKQNEFGGTISGPLKRDRIFYFGAYEGYRLRQGDSPAFYSLPTAAEQQGNFSALPVAIYDPATQSCTSGGVCSRQQFSGNIIPSTRISSISSALQSPLPAPVNTNLQNNFLGALTPGIDQDRFLVKTDVNVSQRDRLFAFVDWGGYRNPGLPPIGPQLPLPYTSARFNTYHTDVDEFGFTHIFRPTLLNQFTFEYNRELNGTEDPTQGQGWAKKAGITGLPGGAASDLFPPIGFSGPNAPSAWHIAADTQPLLNVANTFGYGDNLAWVRGKHSLTFGVQVSFQQYNQADPLTGSVLSGFNFSNNETAGFNSSGTLLTSTGNSYASYLLGLVDNAALTQSSVAMVGGRNRQYSFFAQDDFKATSRLTLNVGLRYDIYTPFVEQFNQESWLNPTLPNPAVDGYPGALQFAGYGTDSCNCQTLITTHYRNFGPRIGFAYVVNSKTVVRGAYGIFYVPGAATGGSGRTLGTNQLGYQALPSFASPNSGISPAFNWNSGVPAYTPPPFFNATMNTGFNTTTASGSSMTNFGDPNLAGRAPYMQDWNFTIQRELAPSTVLTVAYAGSNGHFLPNAGAAGYANNMQPRFLALGTLLTASATAANIASAQAIIPGVQLPYANFAGTIGQMLRPFPQYSGVGDNYALNGNSNYNALQASAQRRFTSGLTFLISYTFSKEIDDAGSENLLAMGTILSPRTVWNYRLEKAVGAQNIPNDLTASYVYQLPFGAGHTLGSGHRVLSALVSRWQISGVQSYIQGTPLGPFGAACNVPFEGSCDANYYPNFSGQVRFNGKWGSGNILGSAPPAFINVNAFQSPPAYNFGTTPRKQPYDLRNPFNLDEDFAVARKFKIRENMALQVQADAFDAFNRVNFASITTNITSSSFGHVGAQGNTPREFQFEAKFSF